MSQKHAENQYRPYAEYYVPVFDKFINGAAPFSWNWAAFFFSVIWQVAGGLWLKGLLYVGVFILLELWAKFLNIPLLNHVVGFGTSLFYGLISNYDYYLLKVHREPLWLRFPYRKYKLAVWSVISVLLISIAWSGIAFSRSSSVPGSYYSAVQPLGGENFQIKLRKGEKFRVSLPDGWRISRLRSEGPWLAITLPGFDELGLGIYDLPENPQVEQGDASLSAIAQQHIVEQSWISRLIYNSSDWKCLEQDAQKVQSWSFCGYSGGANAITYQVVFSALDNKLLIVTHSARSSADEVIFQKNLKLFLASVHRVNDSDKFARSN